MATASFESGAAETANRSRALRAALRRLAAKLARSWPFIAFFVRVLPVLGVLDRLVRHPGLYPAKPSEIVTKRRGRLRPAPQPHLCHRRRNGARLCRCGDCRGAARPWRRLFVNSPKDHLSVLRQHRDDAEDRLRAALHLMARLRPPTQGHHHFSSASFRSCSNAILAFGSLPEGSSASCGRRARGRCGRS